MDNAEMKLKTLEGIRETLKTKLIEQKNQIESKLHMKHWKLEICLKGDYDSKCINSVLKDIRECDSLLKEIDIRLDTLRYFE